MKRVTAFITALLILLSCFALAACGNASDEVNEHNVALLEAQTEEFGKSKQDEFEKVGSYVIVRDGKVIDAKLKNGKKKTDQWTQEDVDDIDVIVFARSTWSSVEYSATGKRDSDVYTCNVQDVSLTFYDNRTKKEIGYDIIRTTPPETIKHTSDFSVSDLSVINKAKDYLHIFRLKLIHIIVGAAVILLAGGIITAVIIAHKEKKHPPKYLFSFTINNLRTEDTLVTAFGNILNGEIEVGDRVNIYDPDDALVFEKALVKSLQNRKGETAAKIMHDETNFTLPSDVIAGTVCFECETPDLVKTGYTIAVPIKKPAG